MNKFYNKITNFWYHCCYYLKKIRNIFFSLTLDKIIGIIFGAIVFASLKYIITGSLTINWDEFNLNFTLGISGGIIRIIVKEFFNEYLNIKGINYNLYQLLYGLNKAKMGSYQDLGDFKPKLYNSMDIDDESSSGKSIDKGKGVWHDSDKMNLDDSSDNETKRLDKGKGVWQDKKSSDEDSSDNETKRLNKGKGIDRSVHPNYYGVKNEAGSSTEPPKINWNTLNPGLDPASVLFPPRINPGPGFNVPGGVVPIRDEICQHIDYNTHILRQFRTMDLETAIEQRNNNLKMVETLDRKIIFANNALAKIPDVPRTENELRLKEKIINDLEWLNRTKIRSEARSTLLLSRIEFIQIEENKKVK